ncbi:MAG: zinc dependent phospholipase C family protein [Agarilytica sp.]
MKNIWISLSGLVGLAISLNSMAFKLDTHAWVGAEVIEDVVDDGKVSIPPIGEFNVDPDIVQALREHPKAYLYGNVGPDFFPDVFMGQMIVHPGADVDAEGNYNTTHWNTDDWFKHLIADRNELSPAELAFSFGYLSHGAADFWAHTYVNTYSGNIFSLGDDDHLEAEVRHFVLEGYVNKFTPDTIKNSGENVGKGVSVLNSYEGNFPGGYIVKKLMLDDEIQDHLDKAPHIQLAKSLNDSIPEWAEFVDDHRDPLYKFVGDLFEETRDEVEDVNEFKQDLHEQICNAPANTMADEFAGEIALQHAVALDNINEEMTDLARAVNEESSEAINEVDNRVHELVMQYEAEGAEFVSESYDRFSELERKLFDKKHELEQRILEENSRVLDAGCSFIEETFVTPQGIHEFLLEELPFADDIFDALTDVFDPLNIFDEDFDPLDPLDLFKTSDGSYQKSTVSDEKPIVTVTGNKEYFESLIVQVQDEIDSNADRVYLALEAWENADQSQYQDDVEFLRVLNFRLLMKLFNEDTPFTDDDWEMFDSAYFYSTKKTTIKKYRSAISGISEGEVVTIYQSRKNGANGFSTSDSGSFFCNQVNGLINDALSAPLNLIQSLDNEVLDLKSDLVDAVDDLRAQLVEAADQIHSVRHQVRKTLQNSTDEILVMAQEYHDLEGTVEEAEQLRSEIKDKMSSMIEDICSDLRKVETFIDEGVLEAAPFVGSYLLDYYARALGYPAKDGALYYEWTYFFLRTWEMGVNQAIAAYPEAQRKIVDEVLNPNSDFEDYKAHLVEYAICEAPKMATIPPHIAHQLCIVQASVSDTVDAIDSMRQEHDRFIEEYLMLGIPDDFKLTKRNIDEQISKAVESFIEKKFEDDEVFQLLKHMKEGSSSDPYVVNNLFSTTNNDYLVFNENSDPVIERVKAEMDVINDEYFSSDFSPAYNSVILAKLTLLNASELNRMVALAGGHSGIYGSDLFIDDSDSVFNIFIGGIRTIDGNHQWLESPPGYIRQSGGSEKVAANKSYNYSQGGGFKLYVDQEARRNVFNKIFKGPTNAAIETPSVFGFHDVIPNSYPYKPCEYYPYPNGEGDETCMVSWLIPVLHGLLQ